MVKHLESACVLCVESLACEKDHQLTPSNKRDDTHRKGTLFCKYKTLCMEFSLFFFFMQRKHYIYISIHSPIMKNLHQFN
jgi:hypothetical protein